jgi:hypothetical protein
MLPLETFCLTAHRLAQELQGFLALSAQEEATRERGGPDLLSDGS